MTFLLLSSKRLNAGPAAGFTLVETIAVLVLLSIVAIVTLVGIPPLEQHRRIVEINTLKSHLRYAQAMAMATERIWGIGFDDSATYRLLEDGVDSDQSLPGADTTDADGLALTVNLVSLEIDKKCRINFDAMGAPVAKSGGQWTAVQDEDASDISIRQKDGTELFQVTPVTGFIE
jgi:prepilin-type N-terminal cleavage/methylation domain-containing protein